MAATSNTSSEPQEEDAAELHFPKGGANLDYKFFKLLFTCSDRYQISRKQSRERIQIRPIQLISIL